MPIAKYRKLNERVCRKCGLPFTSNSQGRRYCEREECKETEAERRKRYSLKYTWGITPQEFEEKLKSQDYKCAICKSNETRGIGSWHVDHDHKTGKIRELLCYNCNVGMGLFKDDIDILKKVIVYLRKHQ